MVTMPKPRPVHLPDEDDIERRRITDLPDDDDEIVECAMQPSVECRGGCQFTCADLGEPLYNAGL